MEHLFEIWQYKELNPNSIKLCHNLIELAGTNNAPTFTNLDNAVTVDENTAVGTTVFTITTSDADMDTLTLSFTSDPTSGTTYFDMDSGVYDRLVSYQTKLNVYFVSEVFRNFSCLFFNMFRVQITKDI